LEEKVEVVVGGRTEPEDEAEERSEEERGSEVGSTVHRQMPVSHATASTWPPGLLHYSAQRITKNKSKPSKLRQNKTKITIHARGRSRNPRRHATRTAYLYRMNIDLS
jgi:hypothetical protein